MNLEIIKLDSCDLEIKAYENSLIEISTSTGKKFDNKNEALSEFFLAILRNEKLYKIEATKDRKEIGIKIFLGLKFFLIIETNIQLFKIYQAKLYHGGLI